ncbi:hypothetical protein FHR83_006693 [Actinoplanes campanulatus]|uniref:Terminase small subunit n=1 Tax=Actinoplanes campanulatus TaxID=113559 RepID=A0A7W5AMG0_9ACTN|nr:hypothetical protein [Actinoplanes campanulatus]MBB3098987.1 hypothetical protein [Actinoplanes campanulatus]GGN39554.1 hypothetical protein GCM10010109_67630 [Actinoplanes campanulatus]
MPASRAKRADTAQRRRQAIDMRMAGASYQRIADQLGYTSRGAACQDITRALEQAVAEQIISAEAYREEELQRLDALLAEAWAVLKREHLTVSHGKVVYDDTTGQPILDDGPTLAAIDRILKIQERRSKYLGLDAPTRVEAITIDSLDAEIAKLAAELEGDQAGEAAGTPQT